MKLFACALVLTLPAAAAAVELKSPNGQVRVEAALRDGALQYHLELDGEELLAWSPLGLATSVGDFRQDVQLTGQPDPTDETASYDLPAGKTSHVESQSRDAILTLQAAHGAELLVRLRVANDGLALSYQLPEGEAIVVSSEATGFAFPAGTTSFLHPQAVAKSGWMRTQPSYEEHYLYDHPVGEPSPQGQGWCLPALFKVADRGWALIGETGLAANYAGVRLANDSAGGVYRIAFPQREESVAEAPVEPHIAAKQWTPWRFIVVGKTLAPIVASTMATDLVEPLYKIAWQPQPGRAAWSWLALKDENNTESVQRQFIDMAAELKFEYILIDALWDTMIGRDKVAELVKYAGGKGVGVILWYNSNGPWNGATQTPRDRMHTAEVRAEEMAWLKRIGVKGIKVDFFGGDKQADMAVYDGILRDAAKHNLGVNFHGATIPRGWDRMYPNFVTCEAVRGMEFCTFEQLNADHEAEHCATLPFTRNVIGPMDFTPVIVGERLSPYNNAPTRRTTLAFELALPVLFHSPIQHFGLIPADLKGLPEFALDYFRNLPTTWDETRLIDGYPGKFAVLARRKGERWYIGAINGTGDAQRITIPAELGGSWSVIRDDNQRGLAHEVAAIEASKPLELELPPRGGAVLISH